MSSNLQYQPTTSVGIFADKSGFSVVLINVDFSNPIRYHVVDECSDLAKISYNKIFETLNDYTKHYQLHFPIIINNVPSLQENLVRTFRIETKELSNIENNIINVNALINDKRLYFSSKITDTFNQEFKRFDISTVNHRLYALFLALTVERKGLAAHVDQVVEIPHLAEVKQYFAIDNYQRNFEADNYPSLPENWQYKHEWF